ncbi:Mannan endo-1,4-beta-mannosidase 2 [Platanthera guangdongensis]|uniref:Mannan endo-1,4-beta-mannosidase 2 n=1 Tax=Platanthera guangdongensis TaxID=2320717 RepID=A0ABR2M245_9ASPA
MALTYISFSGFGSHHRENSELSEMSFVRRGAQLVVNGSPFYVNGWNSYWLMTVD